MLSKCAPFGSKRALIRIHPSGENMSKQKKGQWTSGSSRTFKLLHQSLTISDINFKKQTIFVSHLPSARDCLVVCTYEFAVFMKVMMGKSILTPQGCTELTVLPLTNTGKMWRLPLNCKQCRILLIVQLIYIVCLM